MKLLKRGFSLMEMMIVMLIVAVVAAASAPMISKKMLQDQSNESPWVWTSTDNSIAYNLQGKDNMTAVLGTVKKPTDLDTRLYIESNGTQISLGKKSDSNPLQISANGSSLFLSDVENDTTNSLAIGYGTYASNTSTAIAIGKDVTTDDVGSVLIGSNLKYRNGQIEDSILIGRSLSNARASSVIIGSNNDAGSNYHTTLVGRKANATGEGAVSMGSGANSGAFSVALGRDSKASGSYAIAIGGGDSDISQATNTGAIAIGYSADAKNDNSTAVGAHSEATGAHSSAYGYGAKASSDNSVAVGEGAHTENSMYSVAIGAGAGVKEGGSISIGSSATCSNQYAIAIGDEPEASGKCSLVIGASEARAKGDHSTAVGSGSKAEGWYSVALGRKAEAKKDYSIAIGHGAIVNAANSVAIGAAATTSDDNMIELGTSTHTVHVPGNLVVDGTLKPKNLDLSELSGTIVLGDADSVVHIRGDLVVEHSTALGRDPAARTYIRTRKYGSSSVKNGDGDNDLRELKTEPVGKNEDKVTAKFTTNATLGSDDWPTDVSDRRLKNVGEAFKGGLAELKKLPLFHYTYKNDPDKTPHVGVMAQDLQKIFPKAVFKGEDGFLRIRMEEMFYALINAVKELDARIDVLVQRQKKIDELEKEVSLLKKQNAEILKRLEKLEKAK